jgi:hypothetical protein
MSTTTLGQGMHPRSLRAHCNTATRYYITFTNLLQLDELTSVDFQSLQIRLYYWQKLLLLLRIIIIIIIDFPGSVPAR